MKDTDAIEEDELGQNSLSKFAKILELFEDASGKHIAEQMANLTTHEKRSLIVFSFK